MGKRKSILDGGSNVPLDNIERACGNKGKRYRNSDGTYAPDSDYEQF
jgi:hypothetical protein